MEDLRLVERRLVDFAFLLALGMRRDLEVGRWKSEVESWTEWRSEASLQRRGGAL